MQIMKTEYDIQAEQFLTSNGLKFRATLSDTKTPAWSRDGKHGHHYRVTLSRNSPEAWKKNTRRKHPNYLGEDTPARSCARLTFDFWGSIANAETGQAPTAYDVLACISGDANAPDTFEDWCADLGYDTDSLTALQTYRRCSAFAKRLQAFFTPAELEQLAEIQ